MKNNKDLQLEEPDKPEGFEDMVQEIIELEMRAKDEHTKTHDAYWQGRKDGLRLALAILQPGERIWKDLTRTSYGFRDEDYVIIKKFMEDARYNVAAILWEIQEQKRVHAQTRINLIQWLDQYRRLSEKGLTNPVTDAVDCDPGFQWTLR